MKSTRFTISIRIFLTRYFTILLLVLASTSINAQKLDSLKAANTQILNDTQRIKYYLSLTREYIPTTNTQEGIISANKGLIIAQRINEPIWQAKCEMFLALHYMDYKTDSAILLFENSLHKFDEYNSSWSIYCLNNLSTLYRSLSLYSDALPIRKRIVDYHIAQKDSLQAGIALINFGFIYDRMKNYELAIDKYRQVITWSKQMKDSALYGRAMGYIGIAKDELKQYDSAHYYNKIALDIYIKVQDEEGIRPWYSNIANTYIKQGKWKEAEKNILMALDGVDWDYETTKLNNLGKIYIETSRYKRAEEILKRGIKNSIKYNTLSDLSECYYYLFELYTRQNKPKKALEFHVLHKKIEDSIAFLNRKFQTDVFKLREEASKKEKELLSANSLIAKRNIFIVLLILALLLICILTYYLMKKQSEKRKAEKYKHQKKLQEEKERISRDLHDNIGSQLTFLIAGTDNEQQQELNQFARDTLDQLRNTVWAIKKDKINVCDFDEEIENYISKLQSKTKVNLQYTGRVECDMILSPTVAINIFRVMQEALSNAIKHAQAKEIRIELIANSSLILQIYDNGNGIESNKSNGQGINFMKQRIEQIGGNLSLNSSSNGTKIRVEFYNTTED